MRLSTLKLCENCCLQLDYCFGFCRPRCLLDSGGSGGSGGGGGGVGGTGVCIDTDDAAECSVVVVRSLGYLYKSEDKSFVAHGAHMKRISCRSGLQSQFDVHLAHRSVAYSFSLSDQIHRFRSWSFMFPELIKAILETYEICRLNLWKYLLPIDNSESNEPADYDDTLFME
ncbi:unnamed protein product [Fasciola hepatica]|uniref:Uncharacterized protein n=1 Tax=Fasciola hepatica TaxID=6192 RepID=A0ABC9HIR7_FASHE|nr:unnamed protein product [Fasciola hepatica]